MDPAHGPFVHQSWFWRKREAFTRKPNNSSRFQMVPDEPAFAEHEQRAYQLLKKITGASDNDDRFRAAEYPHGGGSQREDVVFQPSYGDAGAADLCRIDFVAAWNLFFLPVSIFQDIRQNLSAPGQETMIRQRKD